MISKLQRSQEDLSPAIAPPIAAIELGAPDPEPSLRPPSRRSGTSRVPEITVDRTGKSLTHYLPQVAVATLLVAISPVVAVWLLRSADVIRSPWICLVLAMVLSTFLSRAGCAYWKRSKGSGDLLFSELLIWGWLGRWRAERKLTSAVELLGLVPTDRSLHLGEQPVERQQQLLRQLAAALEAEDRYTRGHSDRVARQAARIAQKMGLSKREVDTIRAAALVHDVGKLRIAPEILNKPSRLTDAEFEVVKRHPVDGAEMVRGLRNDELTAIVRHHHERMDGNGYPDGLAGERIPVGARIIAVADTFDAITSVRSYRPRRDHKKALDILAGEQGRQLDRDAVRAFVACYSGSGSVAVWSAATSLFERTVSWITGEASAATMMTGNVVATAVATFAIGGVAMASPLVIRPGPDRVPANGHSSPRSRPRASGAGLQTGSASHLPARSPAPSGRAVGVRRSGHHRPSAVRSHRHRGHGSASVTSRGKTHAVKAQRAHPPKPVKTHPAKPVKFHQAHPGRAVKVHQAHPAKPVEVHQAHPAKPVKVHKAHPAHPVHPVHPHSVEPVKVHKTHPVHPGHPVHPTRTHPAKG